MSRYSRWEARVLSQDTKDRMVAYVNGYLLALEDIVNDMNELAASGDILGNGKPADSYTISAVKRKIRDTLEQANRTRDYLGG